MKSNNLLFSFLILLFISCSKDDPKPAATWSELASPAENDLTDVEFFDENFGVISGAFGTLLKTENGGSSWEELNVGLNHSFVKTFILSKNEFFTSRIGLYKTTDGGNTFTELGNLAEFSGTIFDMHFFDSSNGVLYKEGLILKTTNGGLNWSVKYNQAGFANKMQFINNNVGYISGGITYDGYSNGAIHKTTDAGNTWTQLTVTSSDLNSMFFLDANTGYFSNFDNQFLKTVDGGQTFEVVNNQLPTGFFDMLFLDAKKGYGVGTNGVFKTVDGGVTWTTDYSAPGVLFTAINKTPKGVLFAVSNLGTILRKS